MNLFAEMFRPAFAGAPARRTRLWQAGFAQAGLKLPPPTLYPPIMVSIPHFETSFLLYTLYRRVMTQLRRGEG
jgi:hypothetical protein